MHSRVAVVAVAVAMTLMAEPQSLRSQTTRAQPTALDSEVAAGIKQVEEGDYDAAILTLDNAARRLAADPARVRELSQAYLYLGIAYVGKGHEAAAKAKFREAVSRIKDLSLSPDKFPPKVIDLFEAAKDEAARSAPAAASASPAPAKKGGGSGKTLLFVGLGGAAAAAVAVGVSSGGGSDRASSTPTTTLPGRDTRTLDTYTGGIPNGEQRIYRLVVQAAGLLEAQVSWSEPGVELTLDLQDANPPYNTVGHSNRTSSTTAAMTQTVTPKEYLVVVNNYSGRAAANYTLNVKHP